MNEQNIEMTTNIIKEVFNKTHRIKCITPPEDRISDENIHQGGEIYTTEDGEIIDLELQFEDFTAEELAKYVEFAEAMYEKHQKCVYIYIICPRSTNIHVKECKIKSDAEFSIKLHTANFTPEHAVLDIIRNKVLNKHPLGSADLELLENLPMMCKKEERNYFRVECFKLMSMID